MATVLASIARTVVASRDEPTTHLHWAAAALAVITGVVHLYLYWAQEYLPFLLAGVAFLAAVALLLAGVNRRLLYLAGVPFTAVQIWIWFVQGMPEFLLGVADKTVQGLLIVALVSLFATEIRAGRARATVVVAESVDPTGPVEPAVTGDR